MELAHRSQCGLIWSLCQCKHGVENDRGILVITLAAILSLFIKVPNICPRACQAAVSSIQTPEPLSPPLCWHRQYRAESVNSNTRYLAWKLSSHISWNHWAVNWWWSRVFPAPACYHGPCAPRHGLMSDWSDLKSQESDSDSRHSALGDWNQWPGSDASQFCWLFLKSLFVNHCIFSTTMRCCYLDRSAAADNGGVIDVWSTGCLHVIQCYSWWDLWKLLLRWWMLTCRY